MLRIRQERLRRQWNQTALAYYAGMSVADVSRIECGRFRPYARQLQKLATVLGVSGDELMQEVAGEGAAIELHHEAASAEAFSSEIAEQTADDVGDEASAE